ncbi:MAG TPA: DUF1549 and DUF1553 domain-containing protein [Fimbriiglobus sp.]|nr:DUF1549 and DUF1553 domain-containing protein [Fimbriiglobus sp.]
MTHLPTRRWLIVLAALGFASRLTAADPAVPDDWAFHRPHRPEIPSTKSQTPNNPVDAFLLARLDAAKLTFAPPADKRSLIRRATFDLTGLPPTPAEIDAFLNDKSPTAYETLVDRLLASPHFGERAALAWLDAVRYAESNGYKSDERRPDAWRYRDYVIASFNADKPYDRFLKEQLAGDELYPGDPQALVATGFLRHYPYESNAVDVERKRIDILNDITDATAAAVLGLTVGCAKCHDHKFDPITQEDYYRFQAFFAGYWPTDVPIGDTSKYDAWEATTADVHGRMAALEKPYRAKEAARQRKRQQAVYVKLIDIPAADRTPWQKQIAAMVESQVYGEKVDWSKKMKGAEKVKYEALEKELAELSKHKPPKPPTAMAMTDVGPVAPPTHRLIRGNWNRPGNEVVPGFLSAIDDRDAECKPTPQGTTGRRTALAKWITSADNPLTARVAVNRVWQQLFGRGIVANPADFGKAGERPTHPKLLDWLAHELMTPSKPVDGSPRASAWALKRIYRLIVTSTAYRQSGVASHGLKADPDNKLLWRMPRKRLDGEAARDAMLAIAGKLNLKAGGPGVYPELPAELKKAADKWPVSADPAERDRRSIYVAVKRNLRYPFFSLFDSPDRNEVCARRFVTTTAPQALTLLNDEMVLGLAKAFAARVTKEAGDDVIGKVFELALGRPPDTEEREAAQRFLAKHSGKPAEAVMDLCHALLNLNEFLYVD